MDWQRSSSQLPIILNDACRTLLPRRALFFGGYALFRESDRSQRIRRFDIREHLSAEQLLSIRVPARRPSRSPFAGLVWTARHLTEIQLCGTAEASRRDEGCVLAAATAHNEIEHGLAIYD
jgi:hypothetical protein